MVQLQILSGQQAGQRVLVRRLPFLIGRSPGAGMALGDPGVWESHCRLTVNPAEGFHVSALGEALLLVNGEAARSVRLRNGDILEAGGARMRFSLADAPLRNHRLRAALVWAGLAALILGQLALIVRFAR